MKGKLLQRFIEEAPVAVAMFDRDLRCLAASPRWLAEHKLDISIIGRRADEIDPSQPGCGNFSALLSLANASPARKFAAACRMAPSV